MAAHTPEKILGMAIELGMDVLSTTSNSLTPAIVENMKRYAADHSINFYFLDFAHFQSAECALDAEENALFLEKFTSSNDEAIFVFQNCDSLTDCKSQVPYKLKILLDNPAPNHRVSIFAARPESIKRIFNDSDSPLFLRSHPISLLNEEVHARQ